jgi:hypothetical protein
VEWRDGSLSIGFTAEYTSGGEPMTFPADAEATPLDDAPKDVTEAVEWVASQTAARFGQATADLLLRERSSAAQYFQPVRFTRETVPVGDGEEVRLVLRATATVDPADLPRDGVWDALVRVKLGGWTKECRLGPAPMASRPTRDAGVVGGRAALPYWTEPHGNLSLQLGPRGKRLGLGRVQQSGVTVTGDQVRARLPLYVPGDTGVRLRFVSAQEIFEAPGTLSPAADGTGAVLAAALPAESLSRGVWRVALCPAPDAARPLYTGLPFALRATGGRVQVAPVPQPGVALRVARRARRVLGGVRRKVSRLRIGGQ